MKIRYAEINKNDVVNGEGISVSYFCQGCHFHCPGCHNPETWNFNGGIEVEESEIFKEILLSINANNIIRNFSILGGEPLCPENKEYILNWAYIIKTLWQDKIKIYLWTGYEKEELNFEELQNIDVIICGKFKIEERDITLPLRGSKNQQVLRRNIDF